MKAENRYIVDNSNRLIIKRNRKNLLTDGNFATDNNNRLIYWLNAPLAWRRQYNLPSKITFQGHWWLNPNYDLELILDESKGQFRGNRLVLKGEIISTDRDALAFEIKSYNKEGLLHLQIIRLSGFWQADEYNRLSFIVNKKDSPNDIITLEGIWQINQNQQITYTFEKTDFITKIKTLHTLTFEGFWQIDSANRLTYILSHSFDSRFDFRIQIESPNLYPKEGVIKYRLGIGLKGLIFKKRTAPSKIISLYGSWKFSRKAGLQFQIDYGQGKIHSIEFGTNVHLTKKDEVVFSLINKRNEPLGMNLIFTHRFLKKLDAEAFLRFKKFSKESSIEAGVKIPF